MTSKQRLCLIALFAAVLCLGSLAAQAQQITEGFESATFPAGDDGPWIPRNQSTVIGTNAQCWNRFTTTPWAPHTGVGHAGANFNCSSGANDISGWLISKQLVALQNGNQVTFWTRKASPDTFPDRLELRLCLDGAPGSCGLAGSTGATASDVGGFTTLLVSVNPTLITGVYPTVFTLFSATLSGLPAGPNAGRIAFRYFVTNGGPAGANSDIISIDDVGLTNTVPVELMTFEVD
jgi:hypothetical protein